MIVNQENVHVFIFGPGFGESIVIYIPEVGWGVVDSCLYGKDQNKYNPALKILAENNVNTLAFLILTHPHLDHYLGFESIIDKFSGNIERIAYYNGDGIREYRAYLAKKEIIGQAGLKSLGSLFKKFTEARDDGAAFIRLGERTQILSTTVDYGVVEVTSLSPSATSIEQYKEILFDAIPKEDGDEIKFLPDEAHNLISVALLITIGQFRIVLGGDLETGNNNHVGWKGVLDSIDCPELSSIIIKVPHHGSPKAFHEAVWEKFSENSQPVSAITPFAKAKNKLPNEEIIDEISKFSENIIVTTNIKAVKPKKIYDRTIVKNMHRVKKWRCIVPDEGDETGYALFNISPTDGSCEITTVNNAYFARQSNT